MTHIKRRTGRLAVFVTAAALLLCSASVTMAIAGTSAQAANLAPTPTFNAKWKNAKGSFKSCQFGTAWKRYKQIRSRGVRLADPVLRFKFLHGLATAAYKAKDRKKAMGYAKQADVAYAALTLKQQDDVQDQAGDIGDIKIHEYTKLCF